MKWMCQTLAIVTLPLLLATTTAWIGSYIDRFNFVIAGTIAGVGNFLQIYYHGRFEYTDPRSHFHFQFWQPALAFAVFTVIAFWIGKSVRRDLPTPSPTL